MARRRVGTPVAVALALLGCRPQAAQTSEPPPPEQPSTTAAPETDSANTPETTVPAQWRRALEVDGSESSRVAAVQALDVIDKEHATEAVEVVAQALRQLLTDPSPDGGSDGGTVRVRMVEVLGSLGDRRAVPVLVATLGQSVEHQPVGVHRGAAEALGRIGDPAAVDPLLEAMFSIPDAMTTTNISERAKTALAAIGEPAVARTLAMLEGRHEAVQALADEHSIAPYAVTLTAAAILGTIGSASAVEGLLAHMPTAECVPGALRSPEEYEINAQRAVVANALGLLGDQRAVDSLCRCATSSGDPSDMFPISEALGRIGGARATRCLLTVVGHGRYSTDAVVHPKFVHEIRWEAARFAVLAAPLDQVSVVSAALRRASRDANVAAHIKEWRPGIDTRKSCGDDVGCLLQTLGDPNAAWFSREVAAVHAARLAPGNVTVAEQIARAYSILDPDARVTMAWLPAMMMSGRPCPACASVLEEELQGTLKARLSKEYQLSVLTARYTIARLRQ